jgi:hypothetical protein
MLLTKTAHLINFNFTQPTLPTAQACVQMRLHKSKKGGFMSTHQSDKDDHIQIHADPNGRLYIVLADLFNDTSLIEDLKSSTIYRDIKKNKRAVDASNIEMTDNAK